MNHYLTVFRMVQDHKWSYDAIQNMIPFERDVMVLLLRQWIDERLEQQKKAQGK